MPSGHNVESGRLEKEYSRLKINVTIGRPEVSPLLELYIRRVRTRAIPVLPPIVSLRSSFVPVHSHGKRLVI